MRCWANSSWTGVNSTLRNGMEVGDNPLYLGVPLLDYVTLGRGCSRPSWLSNCLTGVEYAKRNGKEIGRRSFRRGEGCGLPFDAQLKD
jgi:hypothetical protein